MSFNRAQFAHGIPAYGWDAFWLRLKPVLSAKLITDAPAQPTRTSPRIEQRHTLRSESRAQRHEMAPQAAGGPAPATRQNAAGSHPAAFQLGESIEAGLCREVKEETGLAVQPVNQTACTRT